MMDETIYGKCGYLSVKWEFRKLVLLSAAKRTSCSRSETREAKLGRRNSGGETRAGQRVVAITSQLPENLRFPVIPNRNSGFIECLSCSLLLFLQFLQPFSSHRQKP